MGCCHKICQLVGAVSIFQHIRPRSNIVADRKGEGLRPDRNLSSAFDFSATAYCLLQLVLIQSKYCGHKANVM
jgi:hypothetical protein